MNSFLLGVEVDNFLINLVDVLKEIIFTEAFACGD
jgi:hypothetical protein